MPLTTYRGVVRAVGLKKRCRSAPKLNTPTRPTSDSMMPQRRCGAPRATGRISPTTPMAGTARTNTCGCSNAHETCSNRFSPAP